jgi:hypothetical protein
MHDDLDNRLVVDYLQFSSTLNGFSIGINPRPSLEQLSLTVRNINNGAYYIIWWDIDYTKFTLGTIISGNEPQNGQRVAVCYISK